MASPSSTQTSSGSSLVRTPGSEGNPQETAAAEKRQRRMLLNRESARRSRMRKQKRLDDMTAQAERLRRENGQISAAVAIATEHYFSVEADNAVLRTRMMELGSRLRSLDEILRCLHGGAASNIGCFLSTCEGSQIDHGLVGSAWNSAHAVMAPADHMLEY